MAIWTEPQDIEALRAATSCSTYPMRSIKMLPVFFADFAFDSAINLPSRWIRLLVNTSHRQLEHLYPTTGASTRVRTKDKILSHSPSDRNSLLAPTFLNVVFAEVFFECASKALFDFQHLRRLLSFRSPHK